MDDITQKLNQLYTGLIYVHYGLQYFYQKLDVNNIQQRQQVRLNLYNNIQELGRLINSLKPLISKEQKAAIQFSDLIKFADYLDGIGAYTLADVLTESMFIVKQAYIPKMMNNNSEESLPIKPLNEGFLSTRYCPDHRGVQAIRINERTYQCPIDGKVYNYETGYVNYQGQQVPGGSIAAQTPIASNYGGIPMRVYDSRQNVLNRIN